MNEKVMTPDTEHEYLKHNGASSIAVGALILAIAAYDALIDIVKVEGIFKILMTAIVAISVISAVYFIAKGIKYSKFTFFKEVWLGSFEDEFLNHVNLIAYKASLACIFLLVIFGTLGIFSFRHYSIHAFSQLLMGAGFLAYGSMVLYKLRDQDE